MYKQIFRTDTWEKKEMGEDLNRLVSNIHGLAREVGHWSSLADGEPYTKKHPKADELVVQKLLLIHSEVSEATEGFRRNLMDDKLPQRSMLECELADVVIRALDLAGFLGLDLGGAIMEKCLFNADRPDHTLEERRKANGKKF